MHEVSPFPALTHPTDEAQEDRGPLGETRPTPGLAPSMPAPSRCPLSKPCHLERLWEPHSCLVIFGNC